MRRFGGPLHLIRRFLGSLRPKRPGPEAQRLIGAHLTEAESRIFWAQDPSDVAHAAEVAAAVPGDHPDAPRLIAASLLHDVGKAASRIGPLRRSAATVLAVFGLPRTRRMQAYLDHGVIGASLLEEAGSDPLVIAFAAHHHVEEPPPGVDREHWRILRRADHAR